MECFDSYLVFTLLTNSITTDLAKKVLKFADDHYKKKPYVFVSNRPFTADVDPNIYKEIDHKVMVGLAIVSKDEMVKVEATNEQPLYDGAFSFFSTVEDAIDWAKTVVKS